MGSKVNNTLELLQKVKIENLYQKLLQQLNKDYQLANLEEQFELSISPIQLTKALNKSITNLLLNQYDSYLNLLYRIDVSESELLNIKSNNTAIIIDQIIILILKREYQKVWFKNKL